MTENTAWSLHGNLEVCDSGSILVVAFHQIFLQRYVQISPTIEEFPLTPVIIYPFASLC